MHANYTLNLIILQIIFIIHCNYNHDVSHNKPKETENYFTKILMWFWFIYSFHQVILVTDGKTGIGHKSLRNSLETWDQRESSGEVKFPLPFKFPCKLHIMLISNPNDPDLKNSLPLFEKLIEINGQGGEVCLPENSLTLQSVEAMFTRLQENNFKPYNGVLKCGNFRCPVQLFPPPDPYNA